MILTRHNTLIFLINHGLCSMADLVGQRIEVRSHSQRNRGFSVRWPDGRGFYVKQHRPDQGEWEADSGVAIEARLLQLFNQEAELQSSVPRWRLFDAARQTLVLDWQPSPARAPQPRPDAAYARRLGGALARLHRTLAAMNPRLRQRLPGLNAHPPWALRLQSLYPLVGADQSWAQAEWVARWQCQTDLMAALAELYAQWPRAQLIHGDMKWPNCLEATAARRPLPVFIDWEMAAWGDPFWDLAGLTQSYVKAWVDGLALTERDDAAVALARARLAWPRWRCALAGLWQGYGATGVWLRLARLCGARLLQTLYEDAGGDAHIAPGQQLLQQSARALLLLPGTQLRQCLLAGDPLTGASVRSDA
jgi:aminoglycoside phosphotransferase (APT) family kinase protein